MWWTSFWLIIIGIFFRSRVSASPTSPTWLRGASKLLDSGLNCDSWRHLGELLGYKEVKLDQFESSYQPSKTLLKDWLESSKGSELSVEMLLACLKELRRFDVIDVISESEGISRSAHRTPNFTNPEFQFPQFKVLQSVFFFLFNIKGYIGIFGCILILI